MDAIFEIVIHQWTKRSFFLYQLELMANSRYMKWLKSLPEKIDLNKIEDLTINKENLGLHRILKKKFESRMTRLL